MLVRPLVRNAIAGSAALVLTLTACSSSKSDDAGSGNQSVPQSSAVGSSSAAGGAVLSLTNGVLAGPNGHTLYFNTVDTATAIKCTGGCAAEWPPLTKTVTAGSGLDQKDFGTATRGDGSTQVTYFGHPLYYFSGDQAAGDKKGDQLKDEGGEWYATTPREAQEEKPGDGAGDTSGSQPASSSTDGGGYTY